MDPQDSLADDVDVRRLERAHPHRASERLTAIFVWVVVGILAVVALGAPRRLAGVVIAMLIGLLLVAVANLITKASFHTAVCAGALVILTMLWSPAGLVLGIATPVVAWARWDEGRHPAGQVILGAVPGAVGSWSKLRDGFRRRSTADAGRDDRTAYGCVPASISIMMRSLCRGAGYAE